MLPEITPHLGQRHAHRRVTLVWPVGTFVVVEKELAKPWGVGRSALPHSMERRFEPLTGAQRQEPDGLWWRSTVPIGGASRTACAGLP
jgi:hypothetical protein